jgi:hypothetical protein
MLNSIKKVLLTAISASVLLVPVLAPAVVMASSVDIEGNICGGTNANTSAGQCGTAQADTQVSNVFANIINFFSLLVGIVCVIMIIIGGFQYVVSNGDTGKISTAKNTIIFALVGLVIVAMAQFIVHFVLGKVTGTQ